MMHRQLLLSLMTFVCIGSLQISTALAENSMQPPDFTTLARQQSVAIVNISSRKIRTGSALKLQPNYIPSDPLYEFLNRFGFPDQRPEQHTQTMGTGFIIDSSGYILTSAHVVDGADEITIQLSDKRQFSAQLIGVDKRSDIGLLKIAAANLPSVKIGNPDQLEVGEWVLAIGAPFGLANTVTQGIVSAKGRDLPGENTTPFIQTDAAINPGNSGGPLFNLKGEVVGINAMIFSHSGGYMGISFAIPIDVAFRIKDELLKNGSIRRGRLGLITQDVTRELADSFGLGQPRGALIAYIEEGGPAEHFSLKPGDILLEFNGSAIANSSELAHRVSSSRPGARVQVSLWREGHTMETVVRLGDGDNAPKEVLRPRITINHVGLVLLELGRMDRRKMGTEGVVMVEEVDGPAAKAGIQPGDMVLAVNNKNITSLEQFQHELMRGRRQIALLIEREANSIAFISLPAH